MVPLHNRFFFGYCTVLDERKTKKKKFSVYPEINFYLQFFKKINKSPNKYC